jgi:hypothetical protein
VEKKETYSTDYTDLSITGLQEVYYTAANEEFSLPQPVVRNGKGEKCELAVVCSIADNSNKAVPKENGKIKVDAGVYRLTYFLQDYNYDFSSEEDVDLTTANKINNATEPAMVEVAGANDGWTVYSSISMDGGLKIMFDGIDVSKYSQIIVRVKTTANVNLNINDTYCDWPIYSDFTEVDLIAYMQNKNLGTTLNSVSFTRNVSYQIWIDSITFVPAE